MADVHMRGIKLEDAPRLARLARDEGRDVGPGEYERFLADEGGGGAALVVDGELVAAVPAWRGYEHGVLGPLMGAPPTSHAIALLTDSIERLRRSGVARIEAHATAGEQPLLEGLGFRALGVTTIHQREPGEATGGFGASAMEPRHLLDVGALDAAAVGYGRKGLLAALVRDHPGDHFVVERGEDVAGFVFLWRSRRGYRVGPLVTVLDALEIAESLMTAAVAHAATWPMVALAPEGAPLDPRMTKLGFAPVGRLVRMRAGDAPPAPEAMEWLVGSRLTG